MNYTDEQMDEIAAMSCADKRQLIELLDRFGDARFWVGRYTEGQERGDSEWVVSNMTHHHDEATRIREQVTALLFPRDIDAEIVESLARQSEFYANNPRVDATPQEDES